MKAAACAGVASALALSIAPTAVASRSGPWVAQQLRNGKEVVLAGETIAGALDLHGSDAIARVFRCQSCRFTGPILARDVVFERTVDLSGSTFGAPVNFRGARFGGPALFRAVTETIECNDAPGRAVFQARADFSLAAFDDFVSFSGAKFESLALLQDARFSDATFTHTCFKTASFDGASFRGGALLGDARFRQAASFRKCDFRRHTDFARTQFWSGAVFEGARFADGASFLVTHFTVGDADEAATFQSVASTGDLNFSFAEFDGALAVFSNLVSTGSLILRNATIDEEGLAMDQLQVRDLVFQVDDVKHVAEVEREDILMAIEESAKARGDLSTANDAHYELQALRSNGYSTPVRIADYLGYRGVAGYFVRPEHPIGILVVLVSVAALVRTKQRRGSANPGHAVHRTAEPRNTVATSRVLAPTSEPVRPKSRLRRVGASASKNCSGFLTCWFDTFALAIPGRGGADRPVPVWRRVEVNFYRVLLVCALIGLASTNPTLREMVDTLL